MKRITKKTRKITHERQMWHFCYNSPQHEIDKKRADEIRQTAYIPVKLEPKKNKPFPNAYEFAKNLTVDGDSWRIVNNEEYVAHLKKEKKERSYYWAPTKKLKLDGSPILQKRKTDSIRDTYFNIPPWLACFLAKMADENPGRVNKILRKIAIAIAVSIREQSGFDIVGIAIHPDSEHSIGVHVQYSSVKNGKLLGISTNGKKGRKGLIFLGDVNLALWRFSQHVNIPGLQVQQRFERNKYADFQIERRWMQAVIPHFSALEWGVIEEQARLYVRRWIESPQVAREI